MSFILIRSRYLIAAATLGALLSGCTERGFDPADYRGRALPVPRAKADFTLTDTDGQPFDFRGETDGYVTLLFFGYTHCPDVCPVHMANIGAAMSDYAPELRGQFKVVFVTTDPERDTPERLREWLDDFDRQFIGLSGSREEVNAIETALGLPASMKPEDQGTDYQVTHAASVVAFSKDNLARLMYPFGTGREVWVHDLPLLAKEDWKGESP